MRTDRQVVDTYEARTLWKMIAEAAWACADPGVQYDTTINDWHTCIDTDRIHASNPCSEYMFLDDSACNLASINLVKFLKEDGTFDIEGFRQCMPHFYHRPGNPGRSFELSDGAYRARIRTTIGRWAWATPISGLF